MLPFVTVVVAVTTLAPAVSSLVTSQPTSASASRSASISSSPTVSWTGTATWTTRYTAQQTHDLAAGLLCEFMLVDSGSTVLYSTPSGACDLPINQRARDAVAAGQNLGKTVTATSWWGPRTTSYFFWS